MSKCFLILKSAKRVFFCVEEIFGNFSVPILYHFGRLLIRDEAINLTNTDV